MPGIRTIPDAQFARSGKVRTIQEKKGENLWSQGGVNRYRRCLGHKLQFDVFLGLLREPLCLNELLLIGNR